MYAADEKGDKTGGPLKLNYHGVNTDNFGPPIASFSGRRTQTFGPAIATSSRSTG